LTNKFVSEDIGAVAGSYGIANSHKILADCIHEEIIQRHLNMPEFIRAFGSYNVAIRRGILEKVGGFEEAYRYASGEDNDLSYKIIRAGYKIYFCKDAIVFHYHQENILKYLREQYRHGVWRMKLYRAHPEMMRGDDYTNWKDIIEPPLALFSVSLLPFLSLLGLRNIFLACFSFYCFMQLPMALRICLRKKNIKFMYLAVVTYVRGFARAFGMLAGIIGK
jgi:GT2 family glycosyltransferase